MDLKPVSSSLLRDLTGHLQPLSRRRFVANSMRLLLLAGSGPLLAACSGPSRPPIQSMQYLDAGQAELFQRLSEVLLPTEGTALTSRTEVPVVANVDTLYGYLPPQTQADLSTAMDLFEHAGLVLGLHFSRFTRMTDSAAHSYIEQWQQGHSLQQGIIMVLKKLVYASYWRDEQTWGPLQFPGPVSERWGLTSLGETPLPGNEPIGGKA
ncbi:MAG: hypothetical protein SV765_17425 [Pseudomonadota bacterium]|nr:hypothetical protein [Pseudomonadales bacterium]MDY6921983.1 hypothetical protein [Pseudomonadota bacterium]